MTDRTPVLVHWMPPWVRASMRSLDFTIGFSSTSRPASLKYPRSMATMSGTWPNHVVEAPWSSLVGACPRAGLAPRAAASVKTVTRDAREIPLIDLASLPRPRGARSSSSRRARGALDQPGLQDAQKGPD